MIPKARVIIVSILLIAALSIALREQISWEKLAAYIGVYIPPVSAPVCADQQSSQLESNATGSLTSLACADITLSEPSNTTVLPQTDDPQIIPDLDVIEQVFSTNTTPQKTHNSAPTKKSRTRRRKKNSLAQTVIETTIIAPEVHKTLEKPLEQLPVQEAATAHETESLKTAAPQKNKIRIQNKINVKELAVKHWTGTYSPTKLEIKLNGIPFTIVGKEAMDLHAVYDVPHTENRITAEYSYEFLNGMRKGSDTIMYTITENAPDIELHFSWDTPWHVELNGAERIDSQH